MRATEYRTSAAARGALLFMRGTPGIALGDRVQVRDHRGRKRNGHWYRWNGSTESWVPCDK